MDFSPLFIKRCFDLARLGAGKVSPNPRVGAVIVHNNKIIGEGYHQFLGGPHAEINAVNSLINKKLLPFSSIYISLEPCNNFGKTPPCVDTILKYKIPKVIICIIDPNPHTIGKSIDKLNTAGVKVKLNVFSELGQRVTPGFFSVVQKNRPYIILKFAQSRNHKIGINKENIWISNPITKRLTHKWRSESNAILIGSNTLIIDNPQLDNRLFFGNTPVKLLLKRDGIILPKTAALYSKGELIVISEPYTQNLNYDKVKQWFLPFDESLLPNILENLKNEGLNNLLVEGGATLINSFIKQNLWDEARIFTGKKDITPINSIAAPIINESLVKTLPIGDNLLEVFENKNAISL